MDEKDPLLLAKMARDEETKHATTALVLKADDDTGAFEAVFSTFDVVDSDGDIVLASALPDGKAVPVVWHHDWSHPVGRGVLKVDFSRAVIQGRFFLETTAGTEAYRTVKAMAELQEYSWGFRVVEASYEQRDDQWIRVIKKVDIYEVSPVLRGAGMHTGTLAIKSSQPLADQYDATLAVVQDLVTRMKSLADLRGADRKSGRVLSEANRQRLATLREQMAVAITQVDDLLASTEPEKVVDADVVLKQVMEFQLILARHNGVAV